jgi:molybdopterin/thiamine biosynthesis adenylyltransferase
MEETGRYTRQEELVPLDRLADHLVDVIGTGAVGRQVCLQLAAMGAPKIRITDFDMVEEVNLAPQGFLEGDLGKSKVAAVLDMMTRINSTLEITAQPSRWKRSNAVNGAIVFLCVDKMEAREFIFDAYGGKEALLIDGRMSGEVMRVFTATDEAGRKFYKETLFSDQEAFPARCTARTTIYSANILAGLEVSMMTRWLRGVRIERNVDLNLITMDLSVVE